MIRTAFLLLLAAAGAPAQEPPRERLDRGPVALPCGGGRVYVGWRLLESDPPSVAYRNRELRKVWEWSTEMEAEPRKWRGQGAHALQARDVDGDGRDEIVLGSAVIGDNGKGLWIAGLGHPDHCYVGEIDLSPRDPDGRPARLPDAGPGLPRHGAGRRPGVFLQPDAELPSLGGEVQGADGEGS